MERVPRDDQHGRSVLQHLASESLAAGARRHDVGGRSHGQPGEHAPDDRARRQEPERKHVAASRNRRTRQHEGQRQAERVAGQIHPHGPPAPLHRNVLRHEQDPRRIGAAQRQGEERIQAQAGPVVTGEGGKTQRGDRRSSRAREEYPARADAIGQRGASHQGHGVGDLKGRGDAPRRSAGQAPLTLQDRQRGRVRDVDHVASHPGGADREQPPGSSGREGAHCAGTTTSEADLGKAGTSQRKRPVAAAAPKS